VTSQQINPQRGEPHLAIIGVPSSAGAYAPGQERAPAALRAAGLVQQLRDAGIEVRDRGDTERFRWRADKSNPRAMNAAAAARAIRDTAARVQSAMDAGGTPLVLGGDCTVELGTVSGALHSTDSVGLVYIDLDTDLNTPASTTDGALDWMGVAHMLGVADTLPELAAVGPRVPLLRPYQLMYFAADNIEPFEQRLMREQRIAHVPLAQAAAAPTEAAAEVVQWGRRFDRLLVHLDLDVLDFADMPLAENTRRHVGLKFSQLMSALRGLLTAPNWAALTICELNPDHGLENGETLREFVAALTQAIAAAPRFSRARAG
jgi:arginase